MRIAMMAFGTRGDVVPLTGLACVLAAQGVDVVLAAQESYRSEIAEAGIDFAPLPGDMLAETLASATAQTIVDSTTMRPPKGALAEMRNGLRGVGRAMADAAADADLLLLEGPVGALLGRHVAAGLGLPSAGVMFQPATPTAKFIPPSLGVKSYGRFGNRLVWRAGALADRVYAPVIAELRAELKLPAKPTREERRTLRAWPVLYPFSEHVLHRPADWPEHVHVTGYLWPEHARPSLPQEVEEFLADGPPPVAITLGSTATAKGAEFSEIISHAIADAGVRAVVQRGWAGLAPRDPNILVVDDLPHESLLPRCSAVVHHCGAGTTAAAVRAGVPSIPVPGIMDQPFWARRLASLGVGTTPLPRHSLTAEALTRGLRSAPALIDRASELGALVRAEDGAGSAARVLTDLLDESVGSHG